MFFITIGFITVELFCGLELQYWTFQLMKKHEGISCYNLSLKDIKEGLSHWRGNSSFIDEKTQYCTDVSSSNLIYEINAIPVKILKAFGQPFLKFTMKSNGINRYDNFSNK